ncbi:MAG: hypothetical protein Q4Q62_08550 [Thermoplasmata archaeon]|nr:hypothetical protein [Thermoplasmata archaeon]
MTRWEAGWICPIVDSQWLGISWDVMYAMADALGKERAMEVITPLLDDAPGICEECIAVRAREVLDGYYRPMTDHFCEDLTPEVYTSPSFDYHGYIRSRMESDSEEVLTFWLLDEFRNDLEVLRDAGRTDLLERTIGYIADAMSYDTKMRWIAPDEVRARAQWMREHAGCGDIEAAFLGKAS